MLRFLFGGSAGRSVAKSYRRPDSITDMWRPKIPGRFGISLLCVYIHLVVDTCESM